MFNVFVKVIRNFYSCKANVEFTTVLSLFAFFLLQKRVEQGGLWHGSRTEKIENHGS